MDRRTWLVGSLGLLAAPLAAEAEQAGKQQAGKVYRIGYLFLGAQPSDPQKQQPWPMLRELGYVEGRNLVVEWRFAAGRRERLAAFASELVAGKPDVILAQGVSPPRRPAEQPTSSRRLSWARAIRSGLA